MSRLAFNILVASALLISSIHAKERNWIQSAQLKSNYIRTLDTPSKKIEAINFAKANNLLVREELKSGEIIEIKENILAESFVFDFDSIDDLLLPRYGLHLYGNLETSFKSFGST